MKHCLRFQHSQLLKQLRLDHNIASYSSSWDWKLSFSQSAPIVRIESLIKKKTVQCDPQRISTGLTSISLSCGSSCYCCSRGRSHTDLTNSRKCLFLPLVLLSSETATQKIGVWPSSGNRNQTNPSTSVAFCTSTCAVAAQNVTAVAGR